MENSPPSPAPSDAAPSDAAPRKRSRRKRLIFLVVVGCVLVTGAVGYIQLCLVRPTGDGPAGPAVSKEAFNAPWTERPVVLLGLGDSMTAGFGASRDELNYFQRLIENPDDEFEDMKGRSLSVVIPNLEFKNAAISGSNSIQHLDVLTRLPNYGEEVLGIIVMTSGGNDLIHWYGRRPPKEGAMYGATLKEAKPWITAYQSRLNEMFDLLNEKFPGGCEVFLGDIYDPTDGVGDAPSVFLPDWPEALAVHGAYNHVIHKTAQKRENVHVVPIHATFLGHGSHCRQFWRKHYESSDPHYWYHTNVEDPNDRGYDALRRIFLNEMATVFRE